MSETDKPFYLKIVKFQIQLIDHMDHNYVKPGTDGLQLQFYFGGSKFDTK